MFDPSDGTSDDVVVGQMLEGGQMVARSCREVAVEGERETGHGFELTEMFLDDNVLLGGVLPMERLVAESEQQFSIPILMEREWSGGVLVKHGGNGSLGLVFVRVGPPYSALLLDRRMEGGLVESGSWMHGCFWFGRPSTEL